MTMPSGAPTDPMSPEESARHSLSQGGGRIPAILDDDQAAGQLGDEDEDRKKR